MPLKIRLFELFHCFQVCLQCYTLQTSYYHYQCKCKELRQQYKETQTNNLCIAVLMC